MAQRADTTITPTQTKQPNSGTAVEQAKASEPATKPSEPTWVEKNWVWIVVIIILLVTAEFVYSRQAEAPIPAVNIAAVNGLVKIPAAGLADHKLHIFSVQSPDGEVRLVAILDDTDTVRAALDACSICGAQGYYQDGRNVICRNCGAAIVTRSIGVSGGCNPIPVHFVIENNLLTISENELIPATRIFKP